MQPMSKNASRFDPSTADPETVARIVGSDLKNGLPDREANRRLQVYGRNELRPAQAVPWWRRLLAQFQNPLVYLLLAALAISVMAWLLEGEEPVPIGALVIGAIVVLNAAPWPKRALANLRTFRVSVSLRCGAKRERAQSALERARPHVSANIITPTALERFGQDMREKISRDDTGFRKTYLRSVIDQIDVADDVVRIVGDKATIEQAIAGD
jgi:hypothetical protein